MDSPITVTSPLLPSLDELRPLLDDIWSRKWITNMGHYHEQLEKALARYLGTEHFSLFTNGTLPLITALQALGITQGEVITTPYSFVATTHAIWWNGLTPVFADIDPRTGNLDPDRIEAAVTDRTVAILPVHVYGCPCDVKRIEAIAQKHHLKVIYDAAHAFGVRMADGSSVLRYGDISTLSFHATKVFNTIEGGALVCHSQQMKETIDHLKNFGFEDEVTVVAPGINSKMDEVRSAYGLLNLRQVETAIAARKSVAERYIEAIDGIEGLSVFPYMRQADFHWNYAYFPIFVDESRYGMTRDALYAHLKAQCIIGRRYFYPLISTFSPYTSYPSAAQANLPVATRMAEQVICLPMHHQLSDNDVQRVTQALIR